MKIAICGMGRAGKVLVQKIIQDGQDTLCCAVCRDESDNKNQDVGEILGRYKMGIPVVAISEFRSAAGEMDIDVVIDFSHKTTTLRMAEICQAINVSMVICTTNFTSDELQRIKDIGMASEEGVVYAPNLTIGINLLMEFVEKISKMLPDFDFEIIERHRKEKKRVTTTAKLIAERIDREKVPISAVRLNGYVGVHEVTCTNENERLTIVHESFSRNAFANGALMAARYIIGKRGYHEMTDVIHEMERNIMNSEE